MSIPRVPSPWEALPQAINNAQQSISQTFQMAAQMEESTYRKAIEATRLREQTSRSDIFINAIDQVNRNLSTGNIVDAFPLANKLLYDIGVGTEEYKAAISHPNPSVRAIVKSFRDTMAAPSIDATKLEYSSGSVTDPIDKDGKPVSYISIQDLVNNSRDPNNGLRTTGNLLAKANRQQKKNIIFSMSATGSALDPRGFGEIVNDDIIVTPDLDKTKFENNIAIASVKAVRNRGRLLEDTTLSLVLNQPLEVVQATRNAEDKVQQEKLNLLNTKFNTPIKVLDDLISTDAKGNVSYYKGMVDAPEAVQNSEIAHYVNTMLHNPEGSKEYLTYFDRLNPSDKALLTRTNPFLRAHYKLTTESIVLGEGPEKRDPKTNQLIPNPITATPYQALNGLINGTISNEYKDIILKQVSSGSSILADSLSQVLNKEEKPLPRSLQLNSWKRWGQTIGQVYGGVSSMLGDTREEAIAAEVYGESAWNAMETGGKSIAKYPMGIPSAINRAVQNYKDFGTLVNHPANVPVPVPGTLPLYTRNPEGEKVINPLVKASHYGSSDQPVFQK